MKGAGAILPVIGAAVFSVVVGIQGFVVADAAGERAADISGVTKASETRHQWDAAFGTSLPSATRFAMHNTSYFLGQRSGGIQWTYQNIDSVGSRALQKFETAANSHIQQKYSISAGGSCSIPQGFSYELDPLYTPDKPVTELTSEIEAQNTRVECRFSETESAYQPPGSYKGKATSKDNRYLRMMENLKQHHLRLRNQLESVSSTYSANQRFCGNPTDQEIASVENDADGEANRAITQAFRDAAPNFPSWMETVQRQIRPLSTPLREAATTDYRASSWNLRIEEEGCCQSGRYGCIRYWHRVTSTINPGTVKTEIRAEDTQQRIPIPSNTITSPRSIGSGRGEWRNLQVFVNPYTHNIQND